MAKRDAEPRRGGRPRGDCGPKMPYHEVDRLLVEGELVAGADGAETRVFPSQRDVAKRFEVAPSLIAAFAKQHRCADRKRAFQAGKPVVPIALKDQEPPAERKRRPGRPRKAEAPLISYEELDRLLVFGEVRELESGATTTVYPTHRHLAERYGVAPSVIASYAKSHNCMRRRDEAKTRIALRAEDKLSEKRAEALAVGKDDVVRMIDGFLLSFEKALKEGRVRSDNPTDVNTMVRLKEFIMGGADLRQEIHAALSLASLQQRYARMQRDQRDATAEQTGVIDVQPLSAEETEQAKPNTEVSARFSEERSVFSEREPPPGPTGDADRKPNEGAGFMVDGEVEA